MILSLATNTLSNCTIVPPVYFSVHYYCPRHVGWVPKQDFDTAKAEPRSTVAALGGNSCRKQHRIFNFFVSYIIVVVNVHRD
jgi:hypothetical protein